ncbi:LTA synthase family protein [Streptococcus caprae]|uniref:LTA synthase family protein n=1 Tax=Streptococcus caprae TaxID=1640501 RepID=A0ABV8CX14_9STRE
MKKILQTFGKLMNTRLGLVLSLLLFYWIKTIVAYQLDFEMGIENPYQLMLTLINPIPLGLLLLGLPLYLKNTKAFYITEIIIYTLLNFLLMSNIIYFREFTDFITLSVMLASVKVSEGLGNSTFKLLTPWDIFYLSDFILLGFLFWQKKILADKRPFDKRASFAVTALSGLLFSINLFMAEVDRPELLTRGFSNVYVVKGLGLPSFLIYDGVQTYKTQKIRNEANPDEINDVEAYVKEHFAAANANYYGIGKGRNVIVIHLESFQQFLIDYKLEVDGQSYEVTPFLNSLYHSNQTFAFSNFFHQVKAGKTSDAETLMETSLFGLNQGSFFVQYGGDNTQYAAPHIFAAFSNYTTAVFHGNVGTFWNRNNVYKQFDYDYWFDQSYMSERTDDNSFQYGLNDKVMFGDSIKYLERLQQPFYAKFITVSNHYPYQSFSGDELGFPLAQTEDETINGYFQTANYLDSALENFFNYLKKTGLYDNSVIVLYGDHYGISNSRNTTLAELLGKDAETWTEYDTAMLQRVPYMIHVPGMDKGFISNTYGGEVDALPTLLDVMGIDSSQFIMMGQDLLSTENSQTVAFRSSGTFVTPKYTSYGGKVYYTESGLEITNPDETTQAEIQAIRDAVKKQLATSDSVQTGDLLRFFSTSIDKVDTSTISYNDSYGKLLEIEKELGSASTSLYSKNGNKSTQDKYEAPSYQELHSTTTVTETTTADSSQTTEATTNP